MGILVPNLIACENDPETYRRQIEDSLDSFQTFESQLFNRAEFGITCRIERANNLLKRLEDLKIKMNAIDSGTTLYFPSKLTSPSVAKFKILADDFLETCQQSGPIENILDVEYEKLRLLKDDAQSLRFPEVPERVNLNSYQFIDFKTKDRIHFEAIKRSSLSLAKEGDHIVPDESKLSESCSSSSDSIISEELTDHESVDESPLGLDPKFIAPSDVPAPPPEPPLLPSDSIVPPEIAPICSTLNKPQAGRANLLASIREGTKLKRVKSSEKKKPSGSDLMSTLAAKLQTRRNKIIPTVSAFQELPHCTAIHTVIIFPRMRITLGQPVHRIIQPMTSRGRETSRDAIG